MFYCIDTDYNVLLSKFNLALIVSYNNLFLVYLILESKLKANYFLPSNVQTDNICL